MAHEKTPEGATEEVLCLPLSDLKTREPAEIQRALGRLVLTFLDSRSSKGLNLPRDLEDEKELDNQHFATLHSVANVQTPESI